MSDITPINYFEAMIPDFERQNLLQSQNLAVQTQTAANQQQMQRDQRQDARNQAFQSDLSAAYHSDDPAAMQSLAAKYPEQADQLSKAVTFQSEAQAKQIGDVANKLAIAERSGNPQAVAAAIAQNADVITSAGADPRELMQMAVSSPDQFRALIGAVKMSALTPAQQYTVEDAQQGRQLQRDQLAETIRSNNASDAQGWVRIGLQREGLEADKEMRQIAKQQQAYQRQLDNQTTELRQQEIQQKIDANKAKMAEAAQSKQMGMSYAQEAANIATNLANNPSLGSVTGLNEKAPTFRPGSQDIINDASRLQSLLTQGNLKMMTGVLTDRDIQFLGRISSGLNITDSGIKGSESTIRNQLRAISNKLTDNMKAKGYLPQDYQPGGQSPQAAQSSAPPAAAPAPAKQNNDYRNLWGG